MTDTAHVPGEAPPDDLLTDELARAILQAAPLPMTVSDPRVPGDPVVWVNAAFTRLTGYTAEEVRGRNCRFLQCADTDPEAIHRLRTALAHGDDVQVVLLNVRKDGSPFWNQLAITQLRDATGQVVHRVGVQVDVTAEADGEAARTLELSLMHRTADRLELLARMGEELSGHLEFDDAVDSLADLVVPRLATWGFVAMTSETGSLERVHVVASDPTHAGVAHALGTQGLTWLTRSPRVAQTLAAGANHVPMPMPVDVASLPGRTTPSELRLLETLGLGSALLVPLAGRDRVLGVLCLVHREQDGFDRETVVTAAHLGRRAGVLLENVRLYLAERDAALTLQHSLLPVLGDVGGLDVAASYLPSGRRAEVGGDWFDAFVLPDGAVSLAVGDVVGHDLRAAASMGQLRSLLRASVWRGDRPGEALERLDGLVRALDVADVATCLLVHWERTGAGAHLTWASAGHPPALVRLPGGEVHGLEGGRSTPVGLPPVRPGTVPEGSADVPHGAVVVLYSDGLVERRDRGLREGIAALSAALTGVPDDASASQVCDALTAALVAEDQEDDVCLLVVRVG
ncbi:putative PAS/PAC sensor protein [Cellulomonas flavigena DSM 20109]|uniref:Putative PAS/PAC sensor protein n=1 Tax=Cellulomonas flavigena (strain ATCC 482 / DSM 20109 / BCRC 11376 / JCM 18109 / NBRC 3775 / NCIMB 8073 / NRS 134) TaxID=446466 RepID=D5UEA1_CELFN|nr:SpoIIE family protein phosphatase [Cellulomonas flavigena]ADG76577.1 putative PAS/PAC sensor protein [Cellulomonas flavigena DSM 20109]